MEKFDYPDGLTGLEYALNLMEAEAAKQGKAEEAKERIANARRLFAHLQDIAAERKALLQGSEEGDGK